MPKRVYRIKEYLLEYMYRDSEVYIFVPQVDSENPVPKTERATVEKKAREKVVARIIRLKQQRIELLAAIRLMEEALDEEKISILDEGYECRWDCLNEPLAEAA